MQVLGLASAAGGGTAALMAAGTGLVAAWSDGGRWTVSACAGGGGAPCGRRGSGPPGASGCCSAGGRAEAIGGTGGAWRALPAVPAGTQTLAPGPARYDALAVSGSRLTVWQLAGSAWVQVQVIDVPIEYGSSG